MLKLRRALRQLLGLCVLLALSPSLLGCIGLLGPEVAPPANLGQRAVGVTTIEVDDATRERKLDVEVWYPAAQPAHVHAPSEVYELRAAATTVARLRSPAHAHRDVVAQRGQHPVVLLSHGAGSSRFANVGLSEILASHGYIVAAPDHSGHTMSDFGINDEDRAQSALDRPIDLSRVLDALASGGGGPVDASMIDMKSVGVAGHSFGGRSALGLVGARFDAPRQQRECAQDPDDRRCLALPVFGNLPYRYRDDRVKAAVLIMPAGFKFYREDGVAQVNAPVLVVGARKDETTPFADHHQPIFNALQGPRYMLDLKKAGHLTATDVCDVVDSIGFLASAFGGDRAQDGCGDGYLSTHDALEQVSEASVSFFDLYLKKMPGAKAQLASSVQPSLCSGACS